MKSPPFNNTDDVAMIVGFWFIQKFTRGKSVETVKIRDDPIQIAKNNSRIIDIAQVRFHTSKLLSSSKAYIRGFVIWGPRKIILSTVTCLIFKWGISTFVISQRQIIESYPQYRIL